jgi:hypothetical protein
MPHDELTIDQKFEIAVACVRDHVQADILTAVQTIRDEQVALIEKLVAKETHYLHRIVSNMVDEFLRNLEAVQSAARQMVAAMPAPIVNLPPDAIRVEVGQPAVNITTPAAPAATPPTITFAPQIAVPAAQVNLPRLERSLKRIHKDESGERSLIEEVYQYSDEVGQPKSEQPEATE